MLYEKEREFAQSSFQNWSSNEVFTFGWFLILAVIVITYIVWLKLLDRKRATQLLLLGSLAAVAYSLNSVILGGFGLAFYTIRLFPTHDSFFISSITLAPIIIMLVQQYTSSWKGYILWSVVGFAFLDFVIFPVYVAVGILEFHNWNVFYHFLVLFAISILVRLTFLWITGSQQRHLKV